MENKEKTLGQNIVGINFNPSGDDKVARAKQLCAELIDLLNEARNNAKDQERQPFDFYQHAIGEVLNAQMNVVKVLTLQK
jgi:hypothetical protein